MSARRTSLAAALAALALGAAPAPAAAQSSKADAFAGKIPPVSGQLYRKAGRVELTATGNLSLNDAFYSKYFGGLKATYHFDEHFAAGLHATGGFVAKTSSAVVCSPTKGCSNADATMMRQVPGKIRYIVGAEGAWSPIYGKLNVMSEQVAHFDLSILAGPDLVAYDEVLSKEAAATQAPGSKASLGGHVGLGMRVFLTESIAARLEIKDYIYSVYVPNGGIGHDVQNQLFAELGVSFFIPSRNRPIR
jgi:outer membrane beta-barrel protein